MERYLFNLRKNENNNYQLQNGLMVTVHSALVKRVKSHFYAFPFGVEVILGINGNIWITKPRIEGEEEEDEKKIVTVNYHS
jgi:exosome complex RNA-binding protein Rrp4